MKHYTLSYLPGKWSGLDNWHPTPLFEPRKLRKALILGCDSVLVVLSLLAVLNLFANLVTPVFKFEKNMAEIRLTTDTVDLRVDLLALSAPDLLPPWELV